MDESTKDPGAEAEDDKDVQDDDEPLGSHPTAQQRTAYGVEDEELA